jgi:Ankyrin repeats (many copies)
VNELPPSDTPPDDIDEHYRRASALHLSRPSAALRRAVLSHAADLAAEHAAKQRTADGYSTRPASNRARWRPAIFGGLAAAALAGLLIAPRFLTQRSLLVPPNTPAAAPSPNVAGEKPSPPQAESLSTAKSSVRSADASRPDAGPPRSPGGEAAAPMPPALEELATSRATTGGAKAAPPNDPAALRQAAEIGDIHGLQMLLEDRVSIDARDAGGRTALMLAVLHGHSDAVDALLAGGADPNAADAHGTTPLQTAVATNQPAVAAALRRAGARAR